jgi:hypothetical protein
MNFWLYVRIKFVHVLAMAIWIGGAAIAPVGLGRSLSLGATQAAEFVVHLKTVTWIILTAAFTTFVSGALLMFAAGISNVPTRIWIGAALTLCVFAVGGTLGSPAMRRLGEHFDRGGDAASAAPLARRFLWIVNIEMAIRVVVLVLMVVPRND